MAKKKKKEIKEVKKEERKNLPIPKKRPTALQTDGSRPYYWPTEVPKWLEELKQPNDVLYRALEGERKTHQWKAVEQQRRPWGLVELGIDAMEMPFLLEGPAEEHYPLVSSFPAFIDDKFQAILPTSVDVLRAIKAIGDGIFWKRIAMALYPYMYPCPKIQKYSYKSIFVQEWFSSFLSKQEPGFINYKELKEVVNTVAPWVEMLDIKELMAPVFRKHEGFKASAVDPWVKESCMQDVAYPERLNLSKVLPYLNKLKDLSICFGFSNYARDNSFHKSRLNIKDTRNLMEGIGKSRKITSLAISNSDFYETDTRMLVRCVLLFDLKLTKLEISHCELDDRAGRIIAQLIVYDPHIIEIDVRRNCITNVGIYFIAVALCHKNNLKLLNISMNRIGCLGAMYLALMLTVNKTLEGLYCKDCGIRSGAAVLTSCLSINKSLIALDLSLNPIPSLSGYHETLFVKNVKSHPRLYEINLQKCGFDPTLLEILKFFVSRKQKLTTNTQMNLESIIVAAGDRKFPEDIDMKIHRKPNEDNESVYSTDSGELTSLSSVQPDREDEEEERRRAHRRALQRCFAKITARDIRSDVESLMWQTRERALVYYMYTQSNLKAEFDHFIKSLDFSSKTKRFLSDRIARMLVYKREQKQHTSRCIKVPIKGGVLRMAILYGYPNLPRRIARIMYQRK